MDIRKVFDLRKVLWFLFRYYQTYHSYFITETIKVSEKNAVFEFSPDIIHPASVQNIQIWFAFQMSARTQLKTRKTLAYNLNLQITLHLLLDFNFLQKFQHHHRCIFQNFEHKFKMIVFLK